MRNPKIGLLPLYVALYDEATPEIRPSMEEALAKTNGLLQDMGMEIVSVPICRLAAEFEGAIAKFEAEEVDAIVTLHLAYSPSLESEKALAGTKLPIIILDTTPAYTYDQHTPESALIRNHGIHGVQDMCNLLRRNHVPYEICAGHLDHSDVLARVAQCCRGAMMATTLRKSRIGLVGEPFVGMGDFRVPFEELKQDLGIDTVTYDFAAGAARIGAVTQEQLDASYEADKQMFDVQEDLTREVYDLSAKTAMAVEQWVKEEKLTGFSINFMEAQENQPGLPVMPFTQCCKAMVEGIGYAGEGDVLTAALTGAILQVYDETTFTEMFCPDWEHNSVFLSHMGEYNYNIGAGKPCLQEKDFPYTTAKNPTVAYSTMKGGKAVMVNLAPFGDGKYTLTLAPGTMLDIVGENTMKQAVNGWFVPQGSLSSFLEAYSKAGATHHSVLVYGDVLPSLRCLATYLGCDLVEIGV